MARRLLMLGAAMWLEGELPGAVRGDRFGNGTGEPARRTAHGRLGRVHGCVATGREKPRTGRFAPTTPAGVSTSADVSANADPAMVAATSVAGSQAMRNTNSPWERPTSRSGEAPWKPYCC